MDYKAVIFDFDYTLGDATDAIFAGFRHGFSVMGYPEPDRETVRHTVGMLLEDAYTQLTGDATEQGRAAFRAQFSSVARPMQAAGTSLCEGFSFVIGGDKVRRPKPDPEGLNTAVERLGLVPEQVLYCGDTVIDAGTADNAGTDFCAVLNGTTPAAAFAAFPHVHIAPDLPDLRRFLGL